MLSTLAPSPAAFDIAWNSPWPSYCKTPVQPPPDFARYGVRTNANNSFNGAVVHTIYCPTYFSTFPHFDTTGAAVNGGIPQRGDLNHHLDQVRKDVDTLFPHADYRGYAVIDWEVWVPWLILASETKYVNESLAYVRAAHPTWTRDQVDAEAVASWNATSLSFMTETLKLCQAMRPRARWGYYGRPGCYTGLDLKSDPPACVANVQERNDHLGALWAAGSVLFPSVYIGPNEKYPFVRTPAFVRGEIDETRRIRAKFGLDDYPIVAFTWYDLFNTSSISNWRQMTNATDLATEFDTPKAAGADGIIVWGGGVDASTEARCSSLAAYFNATLGPKLASLA